MQEFAAISVSTYDPDSLVAQLNERAADGWSVVSIVPTGSTITAHLSRAASGATGADGGETDHASVDAAAMAAAVAAGEPAPEPAPKPADDEPAPAEGGDGWAASVATAAAVAAEPATEPTLPSSAPEPTPAVAEPAAVAPAAEPAVAAASAAPAGWYADPSSRYELRYWDGSTWTEHVSRGGQQFTDPPVA